MYFTGGVVVLTGVCIEAAAALHMIATRLTARERPCGSGARSGIFNRRRLEGAVGGVRWGGVAGPRQAMAEEV